MSHPRLRLAAARYALGVTTTDELVEAADQALTDSVYSYSLGELGTFRNPTWADVLPLFRNALEELEIPVPPREEAIQTIIGVHATAIAEGAMTPRDGLRELYDLDFTLSYSSRKPVEPELLEPLGRFVDYWQAYDALGDYTYLSEQGVYSHAPDAHALESLDREVIQFAMEWCLARWGPSFDPAWRTSTATALARQMYESRDFGAMPILADALQDAGCDSADVLEHCRDPHATHVRGCWALDLVLGKE